MKVSEVMSVELLTATLNESVRVVVGHMVARGCGSVPVVDDGNHLLGIIAIRDIMIPLYPNMGNYAHDAVASQDFETMEAEYGRSLDSSAGELMTASPMTVASDDSVLKAASYMGLKNLRRIPVTDDDNRLLGIISIGDINRALFLAQGESD
ncbi:MAG: CBS domain-containing protein [Mariprofundales bacterium]|nr:CBS domain-containing protein [Mariprofundales bacterium]